MRWKTPLKLQDVEAAFSLMGYSPYDFTRRVAVDGDYVTFGLTDYDRFTVQLDTLLTQVCLINVKHIAHGFAPVTQYKLFGCEHNNIVLEAHIVGEPLGWQELKRKIVSRFVNNGGVIYAASNTAPARLEER